MNNAVMPSTETTSPEPSDYFEQIPQWSADGSAKRFEIMADAVSGRIPVTRLESWRDFTELLESDFFNRHGVQLVFRGHRRFDWSLMPTLGRLTTNGIVTEQLAQAQMRASSARCVGVSTMRPWWMRMTNCGQSVSTTA